MDIKVNQMQQMNQIEKTQAAPEGDGSFKFTLISNIEEQELQARLTLMMEDIT